MALKYYSLLNVNTNNNDKSIFMDFIKSIYTNFLDDYNHLLYTHDEQLQIINQSLIKDSSFGDCNISKCNFASRHHKKRTNNNHDTNDNDNIFDGQFEFYKTTMDSLHFYLLHLFHVGLRTMENTANQEIQEEEEIKQEEEENKNFDKEFSQIVKAVNDRRHISDSFDRFKSNDKFNISAAKQTGQQYIFICFVSKYTSMHTIKINR